MAIGMKYPKQLAQAYIEGFFLPGGSSVKDYH